jgi:hypothetical protein
VARLGTAGKHPGDISNTRSLDINCTLREYRLAFEPGKIRSSLTCWPSPNTLIAIPHPNPSSLHTLLLLSQQSLTLARAWRNCSNRLSTFRRLADQIQNLPLVSEISQARRPKFRANTAHAANAVIFSDSSFSERPPASSPWRSEANYLHLRCMWSCDLCFARRMGAAI